MMNQQQSAHYDLCRQNGCSHAMAEMLATRTFPGVRTDAVFLEGHCNGNQFAKTPWLGDAYKAAAEAAGVDTTGKVYLSGLASYPGDPKAWVSGRGDVLRVAAAEGLRVTGMVNYQPGEREPMPDVAIADDILNERVARVLDEDPDQRYDDAVERATQLATGAVDPNPLLVSDIPPEEGW